MGIGRRHRNIGNPKNSWPGWPLIPQSRIQWYGMIDGGKERDANMDPFGIVMIGSNPTLP